jgi:hypothetical protein
MIAAQTGLCGLATENRILISRLTVLVDAIIDVSSITTGTEYFNLKVESFAWCVLVPF